jgi:FkbH-like protein
MYRADLTRQAAERDFSGSAEEFLSTLDMRLDISPVTESDLQRVEELTVRTHQLNSTGYTYSYEELLALSQSPNHIFRIYGLKDRYGDSGKVGLLLLENGAEALRLKLLIVSCRVMSRGIGSALLSYATQLAALMGKKLQAEFFETEHNRIMYITYKLAGFEEIQESGSELLLEYQKSEPMAFPPYLTVTAPTAQGG